MKRILTKHLTLYSSISKEYDEKGLDYLRYRTKDAMRDILSEAMDIYDTGNLTINFEVKHTGQKEWMDENGQIKEIIYTYSIVGAVSTEPSRVCETV